MCGIAGFLAFGQAEDMRPLADVAGSMADTISHRGPDDSGVWNDDMARVALAHRRLSILDLSPAGHQPMVSAPGRYVIVFNGEIYNHLDLRRQLSQTEWRGHSDTETLLAGFEAWGVKKTLERSVGMFAFALWDRLERTLTLARDRLGEKPLYYGWQGETFLFGSELKALRAHPAFIAGVDRGAAAAFLRHGYVPSPYSIYAGIRKLPPGTYLNVSVDLRHNAPLAYWSSYQAAEAGICSPFAGNDAEAVTELETQLSRALASQMIADVPLGAFLSGGIDSSMIVALMQARSTARVKTFTIGFEEGGYNEAEQARAVARHLGTDHTELYVSPAQAQAVIPRLPILYDEPFADSSQIPTFLVSELARKHVAVSLSGDGGDELFGGYNRHFWAPRLWRQFGSVPAPLRTLIAGALTRVPPAAWNRIFAVVGGLLPSRWRYANSGDKLHKLADMLTARSPEEIYRQLISQWPYPTDLVPDVNEPATILDDAAAWSEVADLERRMMYLDQVSYLPDDILVKVDRAAMGVSLETRVPMLDHRLVEFAWSLPLSMKIRHGQGKWVLRQLLYRHLPKALVDRPKMGFGVPLDAWLRGPLRGWAENLLDETRLRREGLFAPAPIRAKWVEHLSGRRNWAHSLWAVLMFQAWSEAWA